VRSKYRPGLVGDALRNLSAAHLRRWLVNNNAIYRGRPAGRRAKMLAVAPTGLRVSCWQTTGKSLLTESVQIASLIALPRYSSAGK
jgi:hypothetical protein